MKTITLLLTFNLDPINCATFCLIASNLYVAQHHESRDLKTNLFEHKNCKNAQHLKPHCSFDNYFVIFPFNQRVFDGHACIHMHDRVTLVPKHTSNELEGISKIT